MVRLFLPPSVAKVREVGDLAAADETQRNLFTAWVDGDVSEGDEYGQFFTSDVDGYEITWNFDNVDTVTVGLIAIPEPGIFALLAGFAAFASIMLRRRR